MNDIAPQPAPPAPATAAGAPKNPFPGGQPDLAAVAVLGYN